MACHAKKSPSAAKIFHNCPGALALAGSIPETQHSNRPNPAAQEGTATHFLLQMSLEQHHSPDEFLGRLIGIRGGDAEFVEHSTEAYEAVFEVNDRMASGAYLARQYICNRRDEMRAKLSLEARTNPLPDRDDTAGWADATLDGDEELEVVDYKNGRIVVEVEDNEQCLAYLLGRAVDTEWRHSQYRITIIQPNAPHTNGPVRSQVVSKRALEAFGTRHRKACELADKAAGEFVYFPLKEWSSRWLSAGEHCLWCRAAGPCHVRAALSAEQARIDFANEPYEVTEPQDIARCVEVYKWAAQIEAHLESCKAYLLEAILSGRDVPGFKLVQRNTLWRWRPDISQHDLVERIIQAGYITQKASLYQKGQLITGPQAKKLVPRQLRQAFTEELLFKPVGELTIASVHDPRKEEKPNG